MGTKTLVMQPKMNEEVGKSMMGTKSSAVLGIQSDAAFMEAAKQLRGRDLCSIADLSVQELAAIMELAHAVKAHPEDFRHALDAQQMVLIFEKASLRTRLTFEAAVNTCGGNAIFVDQTQSPLGERESLGDMAHNLERWMNIIVLRTYSHDTVLEMAATSKVPVINALSDYEHPCQAIADFFTLEEKFGSCEGLKFTYVGDGNNVCHSLILAGALLGAHCTVATPRNYEPKLEIIHKAIAICEETGGSLQLTHDAIKAATGADAIYTDVCISMGQEHEATKRAPIFKPYQVNEALMAQASEHAVFMHCLPAHRGAEVTDAVMDSPQAVIFDQAENRLHAQKALMLMLLGGAKRIQRKRGPDGKKRTTLA
ncbi:ornithine carbamoyltransferase [Terriglobus saanensis]|uniref:Ornithine carbamoyltransferase n=1 Tax=Terriglobus saanensis (strain ATCC BAA-1853 / DSM 23119 / SP1PR4) TaxID=401053 RepID=E8V7T5_TERSS|nr:ornithine carbamoyltransferase [Terriglobus saanensis]ADV82859.1 ornithine carbamoyltransferase [Terriglobus saanensis SP1PR4]